MIDTKELINRILYADNANAFSATNELVELSKNSDLAYGYFDVFEKMLESKNSYMRNRAFALIAANSKWDNSGKCVKLLPKLVIHLSDEKPISVRKCIAALAQIGKVKSETVPIIKAALLNTNVTNYNDSMAPLIEKDIKEALISLEQC